MATKRRNCRLTDRDNRNTTDLTQYSDIIIETDANCNMTITCNKRKISLCGKNGDDFTFLPKIEKKDSVAISMMTIKDIISKTIFSIGNGDINKVMSGVHVVIKNDQMRVTTLDGHRISLRNVELNIIPPFTCDIYIPMQTIALNKN